MKKQIVIFIALIFASSVMAKSQKETIKFYVFLHCDACVEKVESNIRWEKGVKDIVCSIPDQTVIVTYDAKKTNVEKLMKAFAQIGKPASLTPQSQTETEDEHDHHHDHNHSH